MIQAFEQEHWSTCYGISINLPILSCAAVGGRDIESSAEKNIRQLLSNID